MAADTCPNAALRQANHSTSLPDCRAYELVTPPDTNAHTPRAGAGLFHLGLGEAGNQFDISPVSPGGDGFLFVIAQTVLPGFDGNGAENSYVAHRGSAGWTLTTNTPTGAQTAEPGAGGTSADFSYQQWGINDPGPLGPSPPDSWLRYPDGSFRPVGEGTVAADPDTDGYSNGFLDDLHATLDYMTPSADHQLIQTLNTTSSTGGFQSFDAQPLTADAPPAGTEAVYDRTASGLHLVSLLPGDLTPTTGSFYQGVSADGSVAVFYNGGSLYARIDDSATQLVAAGAFGFDGSGDVFGWVTDSRVFYARAGDLFAYDLSSQQTTQLTSSGDATFVRVSEDGSHVFFTSPSQLDGSHGVVGQPNLYVWDGQAIHFIATVRSEDLSFDFGSQGLTSWAGDAVGGQPADRRGFNQVNTSRATPDGSVFLFLSSADLTGHNPANHYEVYRYDTSSAHLDCVSCAPGGGVATGDARLAQNGRVIDANGATTSSVVGTTTVVPNVTNDGQTVFFESDQDLLPSDSDGLSSVYEWKAGKLSLLSSGHSSLPNHLVGMTPDGSEVFIETADQLVPQAQQAGVPGIYAARVDGGFPQPASSAPCLGDACQGAPSAAPAAPVVASVTFSGSGNAEPGSPAGKPKVLTTTVRGATFLVKVKVPGNGRISITGRGVKRVSRIVGGAGIYELKLSLTANERRVLARKHRLKLRLRVSYRRPGATAQTAVAWIPVKPARHHARPARTERRAHVRRATDTTGRAGK